jgi:hypothetical protein
VIAIGEFERELGIAGIAGFAANSRGLLPDSGEEGIGAKNAKGRAKISARC